jgi:predicted glycosyltransferase
MVNPRELTADALHAAMTLALGQPRPTATGQLRLDGAARVADHLLELATARNGAG